MKSDKSLTSEHVKAYNREYFEGDRELSRNRIETTISLLGNVRGKRILDVGSGTAEGSILLRARGANVISTDFSRYAITKCHEKELDGVLAVANILPFCEGAFDHVLLMDVIEHIPRDLARNTLSEIKRVTKSEGKIAIHTMPTLFLEKLSMLYGLVNRRHWRRWGVAGGHINTYTPWRLEEDILSVGLDILLFKIGSYPKNAPLSSIISPLSQTHLFRRLLGNDLWVCCKIP